MAGCYKVNDFQAARDGVLGVAVTSGNVPINMTTMNIGTSNVTGGIINGYIRRITYYPRRLPDATLQQITS
jgi:hypothetical protein